MSTGRQARRDLPNASSSNASSPFRAGIDLLPHGLFSDCWTSARKAAVPTTCSADCSARWTAKRRPRRAFRGRALFQRRTFRARRSHRASGWIGDTWRKPPRKTGPRSSRPSSALCSKAAWARERHAFGAHFTSEADIQKVVLPTIVRPWRQRIDEAKTARELLDLRQAMLRFHVLDPACGSGNFLYVAYRELKRLEMDCSTISTTASGAWPRVGGGTSLVMPQFFGIDIKPFAVELAKVTLMLAKKLALDEIEARASDRRGATPLDFAEKELPLDNLDANIRADDALFCDWPRPMRLSAIRPIWAPLPRQGTRPRLRPRVYAAFPAVPSGRFLRLLVSPCPRRPAGRRASRSGRDQYDSAELFARGQPGLHRRHGGTITEAVSTQVWSGEAAVHVSIVNWIKGEEAVGKRLFTQVGDDVDSNGRWTNHSASVHRSGVEPMSQVPSDRINERAKVFHGQNPVNGGFFLVPEEADYMSV